MAVTVTCPPPSFMCSALVSVRKQMSVSGVMTSRVELPKYSYPKRYMALAWRMMQFS